MGVLKITAKGQVTLRKDVLQHLGVTPGQKVEVDLLPNGRVEIRSARKTGKISDVFGMFDMSNGPHLSIEDIKRITEESWAGKR